MKTWFSGNCGTRYRLQITLMILSLSACGGGEDVGTDEGFGSANNYTGEPMNVPSKLVVLTAPEEKMKGDSVANNGALAADWSGWDDKTTTDVYHPSLRALRTANELFCEINQAIDESLVNIGAYLALVDSARCQRADSLGLLAKDQQLDPSSTAPQHWIVENIRVDNESPQRIRAWVSGDGGFSPDDLPTRAIELIVYSAPSAAAPNGHLTLRYVNYSGRFSDYYFLFPREKGVLEVAPAENGAETIQMIVDRGLEDEEWAERDAIGKQRSASDLRALPSFDDFDYLYDLERVVFKRDPKVSAKQQLASALASADGETRFRAEFDQHGFLVDREEIADGKITASVAQCLSRTEFTDYVMNYNITDVVGKVVEQSETVRSIEFVNGTPVNGFLSAGMSSVTFPNESESREVLQQGDRVELSPWEKGAQNIFSLGVSPGRLSRVDRYTASTQQFAGSVLRWYGNPPASVCGSNCSNSSNTYLATIAADGKLYLTHVFNLAADDLFSRLNTAIELSASLGGSVYWLNLGYDKVVDIRYEVGSAQMSYGLQKDIAPKDSTLKDGMLLNCYKFCPIGGEGLQSGSSAIYSSYSGVRHYRLDLHDGGYKLVDLNQSPQQAIAYSSDFRLAAVLYDAIHDPGSNASNEQLKLAAASYIWDSTYSTHVLIDDTGNHEALVSEVPFPYIYTAGDDVNISDQLAYHPAGNFHALTFGHWGGIEGLPQKKDPQCQETARYCFDIPSVNLRSGVHFGLHKQWVLQQGDREIRMNNDASACSSTEISVELDSELEDLRNRLGFESVIGAGVQYLPILEQPALIVEGVLQNLLPD